MVRGFVHLERAPRLPFLHTRQIMRRMRMSALHMAHLLSFIILYYISLLNNGFMILYKA